VLAAKLDAQVDGGIEWNWSPGQLGHWAGTETDTYAAKLTTRMGPMVRIYEFDRFVVPVPKCPSACLVRAFGFSF
jgi:hypothetical protein